VESNPPAAQRAGGKGAPTRGKPAASNGFALKLKDKGAATDKEFERY
jgi:hypothetical protein